MFPHFHFTLGGGGGGGGGGETATRRLERAENQIMKNTAKERLQ